MADEQGLDQDRLVRMFPQAPIKQVTGLDTPIPYSKPMEEHVLPNEDKIVEAVRQVLSTTLVT
jgi:pyruvate/2-oxoglutarate/acetoin dehydrogenase E1 component